jgi:hypothetical protein
MAGRMLHFHIVGNRLLIRTQIRRLNEAFMKAVMRGVACAWLGLALNVAFAQEARPGNGPVSMKAGSVQFVQQGAEFDVQLNGTSVDRFGARRIAHFDEPSGARMLVEAFGSGAPDVYVYDFRRRPPVVEKVGRRMSISGVFWQVDEIVLKTSGGWYRYQHGELTPLTSTKTVFH